jgi:hypothetical protein
MRRWLFVIVILLACTLGSPASMTPIPRPIASSAPTAAPVHPTNTSTPISLPTAIQPTVAPIGSFKVAVIVDDRSEPVSRDQAQAVIQEASLGLKRLAQFEMLMIDFVDDNSGEVSSSLANNYLARTPQIPNGIVIFSFGDDGQAKLYGGYSMVVTVPNGGRNSFISPLQGSDKVYVAVIHFSHRFAACGYDDTGDLASTTSIDGECRNQSGTACVQRNGYSMCANLTDALYASTPTYFAASTIVHEFLHPFGVSSSDDHYGTPGCNAITGMTPAQFDLNQDELYNGICPYIYDRFKAGFQP